MTKSLVNADIPCILEEIDHIVAAHPEDPRHNVLEQADVRQRLIAFVLNRIPGGYVIIDDIQTDTNYYSGYVCPSEKRAQIQDLLREGIEQLLSEEATWISHHVPERVVAEHEPSHWFG